ncbi:hypothetical protein CUMW_026670 [Citrus unshiu]|nr:hypothetical protein CUMW_026670 [Citrus unshiu]
MASHQHLNFQGQIPGEFLIARIMQIHASISKLESLRPSKQVNILFSHLVKLCILPSSIDIKALPQEVQQMRQSLIILCARAESLLELEFATYLSKISLPLNDLNRFPYYENYVKLAKLEYGALIENTGVAQLKKVAFVGSGPMPLTSIILASQHMKSTHFDNIDIDETANNLARRIVSSDDEIEKRMKFLTCDIMEVKEKLGEYDCIILAALAGNEEEKAKILGHIRKYMKEGGVLLVRSAKGARAFLYPVVEEHELFDFKVLSIFHPTNDVINSVVLLQLPKDPPKLVLKDKESVSLLQENRPRITSQLLHDKLLPQASPNNKPYLFNGNSCPCNHLEALDASKRAKITGKKKMARAEKASEEAPSSSQANTSKFQSDQWLEIESTSSGLTLADLLREKRAEVEHLAPLIQKADRVIPKSHAADAEKIPLSTTWDIALANLLRVAYLLELHRPLAMKSFDGYIQMAQNLEAAQKQVTELSEKIRSEQDKNRQLRNSILQLTQSLQAEKKRRFEVEAELETLKQKVDDQLKAANNA